MSSHTQDKNMKSPDDDSSIDENILSQWQLIRMRFCKHKLALASLFIIIVMYTLAMFSEFFSPVDPNMKRVDLEYHPPQPLNFSFEHGLHTKTLVRNVDPATKAKTYTLGDEIIKLKLFGRSAEYHLMGFIPMNRRFLVPENNIEDFGTKREKMFYLFGADRYGRCLLSRIIDGSRISLSIGIMAIAISFCLGLLFGGLSGYIGGWVDMVIQRSIEIIGAIPNLPLWMALGAAIPQDWPPLKAYFAIGIVFSLIGWCGLARVVRGKILSLREEEYALAARLLGASHWRVLFKHLIPGFMSHIIVTLTMTVPGMILGEVGLSFLGLGLRPPVVSWGVMLQDCMNMQALTNYPWLLFPLIFIVLVVLSFNFFGDGLRDAADPYSSR